MNYEILGIGFYVILMLTIGFVVSKRINTDDDYFLAGRSLGPTMATFSIFATWFGAETCIGTAGAVYRDGLSSVHADPVGYSICIILMGFFFSRILWRRKITTIPDLFRERFSLNTERLAAVIMIPSSLIWAGAQIRAFGQIIHSATDMSVSVAITLAASVVLVYTVFGGMLADAYTDLIQGITVIAGLIFLGIILFVDLGGIMPALSTIDLSRLSLTGGDMAGLSFMGRLELWMVPILGSLMAQELVSRVISSKSEKVAAQSCYRAGGLYILIGTIPVLVGLLGRAYYPDLENSEVIMPLLAKTHFNYFFYIIFVGALVSAILSTVDTTLLSASALAGHNLVNPMLKDLTEKKKVIIARGGVFISGLIAYSIAFMSDSVTELVEAASALGGPSILVITTIALFVKRGSSFNAIIAIVTSIVVWLLGHYVIVTEYPVILTVVACGLAYFMSLPLTRYFEERSGLKQNLN
jgi:solute:Na+ symporter, SSS family